MNTDFVAEETGIRGSNRIAGEETVRAEDYISGKAYPDAVCYAFYPIDLHVMDGIRQRFFEKNVVGQIPYGTLIPRKAKCLLAAGCAAAICARENIPVRQLPHSLLRAKLEFLGAIVP